MGDSNMESESAGSRLLRWLPVALIVGVLLVSGLTTYLKTHPSCAWIWSCPGYWAG